MGSATAALRSAQAMAETLSRQLRGTKVVAVQANGNLPSVFEEDAFLVVEPARRESLRVGDMITYEHPQLHTIVVQRLLKTGDVAAGADASLTRVVAVIYARKFAGAQVATTSAKKPPLSGETSAAAASAAR